jgi:hypothetical protein
MGFSPNNYGLVSLSMEATGADTLVRVGQSTVKNGGRGVFVVRDIAAGQEICEYDSYRVVKETTPHEHQTYMHDCLGDTVWGWLGKAHGYREGHVGQLINDGAQIVFSIAQLARELDDPRSAIIHRLVWTYLCTSIPRCNVIINEVEGRDAPFVTAARNIKAGEELFTTYGPHYWLGMRRLKVGYLKHITLWLPLIDRAFLRGNCIGEHCKPCPTAQLFAQVWPQGTQVSPLLFLGNYADLLRYEQEIDQPEIAAHLSKMLGGKSS